MASPNVTAATGFVALLGDPVAHSVSPSVHAAGFDAYNLDLVYLACQVASDELEKAIDGLWALGAVGANITVPYKEAVARLLADQAPEVEATGAANTLVRTVAGWRAENTDVVGFLAPLPLEQLAGQSVVVLGAGGAARAVVYALAAHTHVAQVHVAARRESQAEALVADLRRWAPSMMLHACHLDHAGAAIRRASLLVNTTPVGTNAPEDTPWTDVSAFHERLTVYDLVYRPAQSRLLREAHAAGARVLNGLPMLIAQAAASFRMWTGRDLPADAAREAAVAALAR